MSLPYYYIRDITGNILGIVDNDGNTVIQYEYDAFGNILLISEIKENALGNVNPFLYKVYYYDVETSLYYCNSRYYNPEWGRWLNADSVDYLNPESVNGLNLFAYCNNNPIMYADPSGNFPILISLGILFLIGAASGVAGTFISDVTNFTFTGEWQWSSWETYAGSAIGYGVAGVLMPFFGPIVSLAIGSGLSTFSGMALENVTGTNNRSWAEIGVWTAGSALVGGIFGHFTKGAQIKGITSGRGSFQHIFRTQTTNMLRYGYNMSLKTMGKGLVSSIVSRQIVGNVGKGVMRGLNEYYEYVSTGDTNGISSFYIFMYRQLLGRVKNPIFSF